MPQPTFISDLIGSTEDSVRLVLGEDQVLVAESWDTSESVFSQPGTWSITLGWGKVITDFLTRYPKRTPFNLYVGNALQFSGRTDGNFVSQAIGGGTTLTIRGRDALAPLQDSFVEAAESFSDETYSGLVKRALKRAGLNPDLLRTSNLANRKVKAGVPVKELAPAPTVDEILATPTGTTAGVFHSVLQAKVNETWHEFVRRHIDRAGLFLWAAADGTFVLSAPNVKQEPTYKLVRRRGENLGGNVLAMEFADDATHRHARVIIYGHGGGKAAGRAKAKGAWIDEEMVALQYTQAKVYHDTHVQNPQQADFFARRRIAEERRAGWRLTYTIAGHTLPSLVEGGDRAVIIPDTLVYVDDEELGLQDSFYIEGVRRTRGPQTTTTITLQRREDVLFGEIGGE